MLPFSGGAAFRRRPSVRDGRLQHASASEKPAPFFIRAGVCRRPQPCRKPLGGWVLSVSRTGPPCDGPIPAILPNARIFPYHRHSRQGWRKFFLEKSKRSGEWRVERGEGGGGAALPSRLRLSKSPFTLNTHSGVLSRTKASSPESSSPAKATSWQCNTGRTGRDAAATCSLASRSPGPNR